MMFHSDTSERRQHTRFLVPGNARMRVPPAHFSDEVAAVVNVSGGGVLVLTKIAPPVGTEVEIVFTVQGFQGQVQAVGKVARSDSEMVGISFVGEPVGLLELVSWLEAGLIASFLPQ